MYFRLIVVTLLQFVTLGNFIELTLIVIPECFGGDYGQNVTVFSNYSPCFDAYGVNLHIS